MEKYTFPIDKYSVEEFMLIFNKGADELYNDAGKIPYEEASKRFSALYEDIPLGLFLDAFGLEEKLNNCYPEWKERHTKIFKIETKIGTKIETKNNKYMKLKLIIFFLAALLAIIIFKMVFVGVIIFVHLVKYIAIAAAIAYVAYWISKKLKKDE
jgi:hypothetical protein